MPRDVLKRVMQFEARQQAPNVYKTLEIGPASQNKSPTKTVVAAVPAPAKASFPPPSAVKELPTMISKGTKTAPTPPAAETQFGRLVSMICDEIGIDTNNLDNDTTWSSMGVDSLLHLQITGRIREEMDLEVDADDLLVRYSTVGELRSYFVPEPEVVAGLKSEVVKETAQQAAETVGTPMPGVIPTDKSPEAPLQSNPSMFNEALAIVADVTGIDEEDLTDDADFTSIGVDSLMSLMLTSRLQDELDLDIGIESFWSRFHTVGNLRDFLSNSSDSEDTSQSSSGNTVTTTPALSEFEDECVSLKTAEDLSTMPRATSVVLQGSPKRARTMLFIFPDGAGSATSYSSLPSIAPDVALIGLNSPYYKNPQNFNCTLDDLTDDYLIEIQRRQPQGPYHFAGWSAGGILAYHATYRTILSGLSVANLILIDSPVPKGLDPLPPHFYDWLSKSGVFGHATAAGPGAPAPEWLFPHFNKTIDTLHEYIARPLPRGASMPKAALVWAGQGVPEGLELKLEAHPQDTEGMKFLTQKHEVIETNGWEKLFPDTEVRTVVIEGANHFSMMVSPERLFPSDWRPDANYSGQRDEFAKEVSSFILESLT